MNFDFIKHLMNSGMRVFNVRQATQVAQELGLQSSTEIKIQLHRLYKKKMINRLSRGLYCLAPEFLSGVPIHEYEIAMALTSPATLAYFSAFNYHKLTDQISSQFYIATLEDKEGGKSQSSRHTCTIKGVHYRIVRINKKYFFGIEKRWLASARIEVTDLERTLIDGLIRPKYCGGFREVLDAYSQAIEKIDLNKIIKYALRINDSVCKRLGWILSHLGIEDSLLKPLLKRSNSNYSKLDPSGERKGTLNKKWHLLENFL